MKKIDDASSKIHNSSHYGTWKVRVIDFFSLLKTYFQAKIPKKHSSNLVTPTLNHQKHIKPFQNSKSTNFFPSSDFFRYFQDKKTPNSNSPYHMKSLETKIYRFDGRNRRNDIFLSLGWNPTILSLL